MTFLRNDVALSQLDSRVNVTISDTAAVLKLTDVMRNEGGAYSCRISNVVGSAMIALTTLSVHGK